MKKGDMLNQIEEERQIMVGEGLGAESKATDARAYHGSLTMMPPLCAQSAIDTHPSIVTLYTSWQARGNLYFLLEFVPGSDLFEEVRRCRHIAPRRAARYVLQIAMVAPTVLHALSVPCPTTPPLQCCGEPQSAVRPVHASHSSTQALDYLQSKRVVYRDLKLENLLLNTTADTVQLADFGLAKQLTDERPKTNTICGTIQYMGACLANGL